MLAFRGVITMDVSVRSEFEPGDGFGTGDGLVEGLELQPAVAMSRTELRKQKDWI